MELLRGRERYGLELVDASAARSSAARSTSRSRAWKRRASSIPGRRSATQGISGLPRRLYRATPYGRKVHGAFALLRERSPSSPRRRDDLRTRVIAFSERFLSDRAFQLIVEPALADLQFDDDAGRRSRVANRVAVLQGRRRRRCATIWRATGTACFKLTLLSIMLLHVPNRARHQAFKTWPEFLVVATLVLGLAMVPVIVCFWPGHAPRRRVD